MKKITYFFLLLLIVGSCKFADSPYSFEREFEGGTYITPEGIVKYISGAPDSAVNVSDNYAVISERITYHKEGGDYNGTTIHKDSILVYGHVFSESPNPTALKPEIEKMESLDDLNDNVVIYYTGSGEPTDFISITELGAGTTFESSLGLIYERDYYIRSFVITGRFNGGQVEYKDIAYNQYELQIRTKSPVDLWVGGGMENAPDNFYSSSYWGGTSFTYNGKLYVAQGHDEFPFGSSIVVYEFDPKRSETEQWVIKYTHPIPTSENFTNAVSFVIKDVELYPGNNTYYDCAYIGIGIRDTASGFTGNSKRIYRINLESETGDITLVGPDDDTLQDQAFPGLKVENAVAFVINGIAYVGCGKLSNGTVLDNFYKYDPNANKTIGNRFGTWSDAGNFGGGPRSKAAVFKIGNTVYLCGGESADGANFKNDLWRATQTSSNNLVWVQRASCPGDPRVDHVAFAIGENGYVGTGWNGTTALNDFWRYDPRLNQWEQKADFAGLPRYEAIGAGIKISDNDYRGYIGTGWAGNPSTDYDDFWHYRP